MNEKGRLIVISGPSGVGKGTVAKRLCELPGFCLSVSRTTRPPRPGEKEGVHYFFTSHDDFNKLIDNNGFFEYAEYNGNLYGTPAENVNKRLDEGLNVILEIEVNGAAKIKDNRAEDFTSVFLVPPSLAEMKKRLQKRGTENELEIEKRLNIAKKELNAALNYDYIVINETVEDAVMDLQAIIRTKALETPNRAHLLQKIKEEY